ncbi:MAG: GTP-binding protein, partial [Candidatus Thermoplasmatota archaeon]|nr:GTP-binding protein [Candidatus Thermoplasmatota archaeon]
MSSDDETFDDLPEEELSEEEAPEEESVEEEIDPDAPLRQPIVAVLGHVDHGKTSLLDYVRGTTVVKREAGAITQHIGATEVPFDTVSKICGPLLKEGTTNLPGLLFIDTPGHHSFSTLRSRGGALADIAVLVVDITEGFKPQTIESINILKQHKT